MLAALHGIIAAISGSLAVTAELVHNIVDLFAAVAVLIGLRLASRKSEAFLLRPIVPVRCDNSSVEEERIVKNHYCTEVKAKGIRVAEWLVAQKIDVVLLQEDVRGKGPDYVLRDAGVIMRLTDKANLAEALLSGGEGILET